MMKHIQYWNNLLREAISFALSSIWNNRLRSLLSVIGVIIGVFSIIVVLSLVDSMEKDIRREVETIGKDVIFVSKINFLEIKSRKDFREQQSRPDLTLSDLQFLKEKIPEAAGICYISGDIPLTVSRGKRFTEGARVLGVSQDYPITSALNLERGRFFTPQELYLRSNVMIIPKELETLLFPFQEAIDKEIQCYGQKFRVVGVLEEAEQSIFNNEAGSQVFLPITTLAKYEPIERIGPSMIVKPTPEYNNLDAIREKVEIALRAKRKLRPLERNNFSAFTSDLIAAFLGNIFIILNSVGIVIGIFAILVAIFGIGNIMVVSVKERTNEIGIQKALGSSRAFILTQFLFESILLCIFGGLLALALVAGVFYVVNTFIDFSLTLVLSPTYLWVGIVLSIVVGVLSGIVPAYTGSKMHPVVAIATKT